MSLMLNFFQENSLVILFLSIILIIVANFFVTTYRIVIVLLATLTLCASVYLKGGLDEKTKYDKKIAELQTKVEKLNKDRARITSKSAANHDVNRRLIEENGRLKNINDYLSNQEIASCTIPNGFIRLHNESASGKLSGVSGSTGKSDDKTE